jgi:magnesium chelatase subunit D
MPELPGFENVIGQEQAKLALRLIAVDPSIGGVLLVGPPGSAKSTLARGLAALVGSKSFVELPLGATEDRIKGSIDVNRAISEGKVEASAGLLAKAHKGVLYVDEINLLPDHLVDLVLDAAASGLNRVERDGISVVQKAAFSLVGTMNPEEGDLRPQLKDRFAMVVFVQPISDPDLRADALLMALSSKPDLGQRSDKSWLSSVRARLAEVRVEPAARLVARFCHDRMIGSLRADIALLKAARALAAIEGRAMIDDSDLEMLSQLVLAHRDTISRSVAEQVQGKQASQAAEGTQGVHSSGTGSQRGDDRSPDGEAKGSQDGIQGSGGFPTDGGGAEGGLASPPSTPGTSEPRPVSFDLPALSRMSGSGSGTYGVTLPYVADGREFSFVASVLAHLERTGYGGIAADDLRFVGRYRKERRCVILTVDASGSQSSSRAVEVAAAVVDHVLGEIYRSRAQVAMVAFKQDRADVVLRPTRALEVARAAIATIERGGATPLDVALTKTLKLSQEIRRKGVEPLVILLTDARSSGGSAGYERALKKAEELKDARIDCVVVDLEATRVRLGLAKGLADAAGGICLELGDDLPSASSTG